MDVVSHACHTAAHAKCSGVATAPGRFKHCGCSCHADRIVITEQRA